MENQQIESGDTGEKKTRVRLLSPKKQLQKTLLRMKKLAQSNTLKEGKAADLLLSMGDLQKMLLQLSLDEEKQRIEAEHAAGVSDAAARRLADASRIQALESEIVVMRDHKCPVTVEFKMDPEHQEVRQELVSVREQRDAARRAATFIATWGKREQVAVAAITENRADASWLCNLVGIDWMKYAGWLSRYRTKESCQRVIDDDQYARFTDESDSAELTRFARACIAVKWPKKK